jgi:hypothetical protein
MFIAHLKSICPSSQIPIPNIQSYRSEEKLYNSNRVEWYHEQDVCIMFNSRDTVKQSHPSTPKRTAPARQREQLVHITYKHDCRPKHNSPLAISGFGKKMQ